MADSTTFEETGLTQREKEIIVRQFLSYCRTAMRYECYDFYRQQRFWKVSANGEATHYKRPKKTYFRSGFEVEEHFLSVAGRRVPIRSTRIFRGLLALEESQRSFLLMRFWLEMSCSEIAKALGCSRSMSYRMQNYALSRMEDQLVRARAGVQG